MPVIIRPAEPADMPAMASIRAQSWETEPYWHNRITRYLGGIHSPQHALAPRITFVAIDEERKQELVGFIAGHLTRRYNCDGELQWIDTLEQRRRQGIASTLLLPLAQWFEQQDALRVCVDPGNDIARSFYRHHGAEPLNQHWMVWKDIRKITAKPTSFERR
ncbi:MAG TPA: GNAT family N-acetyltransferase [Edaphobacter sp.]|jgi:ribosomal protein S18 acetylase RimI-like enzyme|nr:GNAT family N-acetyltransferase [Edaphobacter sp.]